MEYMTTYQSMYNDAIKNKHVLAQNNILETYSKKNREESKKTSHSAFTSSISMENVKSPVKKKREKKAKKKIKDNVPLCFAWSLMNDDVHENKENIQHRQQQGNLPVQSANTGSIRGRKKPPQTCNRSNAPVKQGKKSLLNHPHHHLKASSQSFFFTKDLEWKGQPTSEYNDQYQWNKLPISSKPKTTSSSSKFSENNISKKAGVTIPPAVNSSRAKIFTSLRKTQHEKMSCLQNGLLQIHSMSQPLQDNEDHKNSKENEEICCKEQRAVRNKLSHPEKQQKQTQQKHPRTKIENIPYPRSVVLDRKREPLSTISNNNTKQNTSDDKITLFPSKFSKVCFL